jgi:hypothetical protein
VGDDELVEVDPKPDPSDSMLRRTKKKMDDMKLVESIVRWGVTALLASGAGYTSHTVADAKETASHNEASAEVLALKQEIKEIREGFAQRTHTEEQEREEDVMKLRERILYLEYHTGARHEPPAAAAAPPPN